MSNAPRKVRIRLGLAPIVLALLAAAAWCGWWFYAANGIEQGFDAQAKALRERGYEVAWSERRFGGFPFRYTVDLKDVRIAEPGGWGLASPSLQVETAAYAPNVMVAVAPEEVTLTRPDGRAFAVKGKVLRASLGGWRRRPPRISVEGVDLAIAAADGGAVAFPTIGRFQAHLRPAGDDRAQFFLSVEDAYPNRDQLLGRITGADRPMGVRLAGEASHATALSGRAWSGVISNWAAAGGQFDLKEGAVQIGGAQDSKGKPEGGKLMVGFKPSRITANPDGRAEGGLTLSFGKASDGMLTLGALGALPIETAAVGAGLAGITGGSNIDVTLTFRDGRTQLGMIPIGPAPRLY